MADDEKRILIDDDWKAQARQEKERLAKEAEAQGTQAGPEASFEELINLIVMQVMVGMGLVGGPDGERIPPNLGVAKHFIDLLEVIEAKTKGNLSDDEAKLLDQVLYELRMRYVEMATGSGPRGPAPGPSPTPGA